MVSRNEQITAIWIYIYFKNLQKANLKNWKEISRKPTRLWHECWLQYLCIRVPSVRKAVLEDVLLQKLRMLPTILSLGSPTNAMPVRNWTDWGVPTFLSAIVATMKFAQSKVPHWERASTMYFLIKVSWRFTMNMRVICTENYTVR